MLIQETSGRPKILNVNDDESTRYSTARILKQAGWDTWDVASGAEALEYAKMLPDLVVLDIKLPDIDGFEVCRIIKSDPLTHTIPVLHLSAKLTNPEDKVTGLENGADGYLTLPFEEPELIAHVRALLRIRSCEQEKVRLLRENQAFAERQWAFMRDVFLSVTDGRLSLCANVAQLPKKGETLGEPITLSRALLKTFRQQIGQVAKDAGFTSDRWDDLILASSEAATNAIVHAGGGVVHMEAYEDRNTLLVWIEDRGLGITIDNLPKATLAVGYTTAGTLGQGIKLILKLVDHVWLLTNPQGTTMVLEQRLSPDTTAASP